MRYKISYILMSQTFVIKETQVKVLSCFFFSEDTFKIQDLISSTCTISETSLFFRYFSCSFVFFYSGIYFMSFYELTIVTNECKSSCCIAGWYLQWAQELISPSHRAISCSSKFHIQFLGNELTALFAPVLINVAEISSSAGSFPIVKSLTTPKLQRFVAGDILSCWCCV